MSSTTAIEYEGIRMDVQCESRGDVTVLRIKERRFTSSMAPELKTELLSAINNGVMKLLLDLREVTYTDSSGLSALLFGKRQMDGVGGSVRLLAREGHLVKMLAIAQLDRVFDVYDAEEDALAAFQEDE